MLAYPQGSWSHKEKNSPSTSHVDATQPRFSLIVPLVDFVDGASMVFLHPVGQIIISEKIFQVSFRKRQHFISPISIQKIHFHFNRSL